MPPNLDSLGRTRLTALVVLILFDLGAKQTKVLREPIFVLLIFFSSSSPPPQAPRPSRALRRRRRRPRN